MSEVEFTNIIQGLFNEKVAQQPLWMDRDFWRYDQIDPWHDDAEVIEAEVRRGVVAVLRVGHQEPDTPGARERIRTLRDEVMAERREKRERERRRRRPLAALVDAEIRTRKPSIPTIARPRTPWNAFHPRIFSTPVDPGPDERILQMWDGYGEVLARDDVELIHAPESCRVADAELYRGRPYTDASGKTWRFDGREWVRA